MIKKPKGTIDIYNNEGRLFNYLKNLISEICLVYNYQFIKTPTFEASELFHRGIGEETDIVAKETYDFLDRSQRKITLRPEGTAGVIRSYIENKMYTETTAPKKLYYFSSSFRYERPQAGRLREHTQFGVEVLGSNNPLLDAEVISLAVMIFEMLDLKIVLKINSLGDQETRNKYKQELVKYLQPNINQLCQDCQRRYQTNPLRILDCKIDHENEIIKNMPIILDYQTESSYKHFNFVKEYLDELGIKYEIDNKLVRGLDYYSNTVFEIILDNEDEKLSNTLCGGGRYNNLVETLGGPITSGIGFALGIERLMLALKDKLNIENEIDLFVIGVIDNRKEILKIANEVRQNGFIVDLDFLNKSIKGQFKQVDYYQAKYIVIIGEDELKKDRVLIKNNQTKEEEEIYLGDISYYLEKKIVN